MVLFDVNVLVYAFRDDTDQHSLCHACLESTINGDTPYGVAELALSGFLRVVTHPRLFKTPADLETALEFAAVLREQPNAVRVAPGPGHFELFVDLCRQAGAKGNLVPDAYFAALAIECGAEWVTTDRDYARFPGLRWRHPLDR